jgi:hypothetical protein
MTYKMREVPEKSQEAPKGQTITVEVPPLDDAWDRARSQVQAAETNEPADEFVSFVKFAKKLVAVPKRELEGERRAELGAKDARIQAAFAAAALTGDEKPDDPQGLNDRIDRLNRS